MLWTVGLFVSTYTVAMVLAGIFQCSPIKGVWDTTIEAKCIQIKLVWIVTGSMNVLTDVLLLCTPIPLLWKLQMPRAAKLQLMGIFSIGSLFVTLSPDSNMLEEFADRALSWLIVSPLSQSIAFQNSKVSRS